MSALALALTGCGGGSDDDADNPNDAAAGEGAEGEDADGGDDTEGGEGGEGGDLSGTIAIDGSSTVAPLSEAAGELFMRDHPEVRVSVGTSGTGGGFEKFCNARSTSPTPPGRSPRMRWPPAPRPASSTRRSESPTTAWPWWSTRPTTGRPA